MLWSSPCCCGLKCFLELECIASRLRNTENPFHLKNQKGVPPPSFPPLPDAFAPWRVINFQPRTSSLHFSESLRRQSPSALLASWVSVFCLCHASSWLLLFIKMADPHQSPHTSDYEFIRCLIFLSQSCYHKRHSCTTNISWLWISFPPPTDQSFLWWRHLDTFGEKSVAFHCPVNQLWKLLWASPDPRAGWPGYEKAFLPKKRGWLAKALLLGISGAVPGPRISWPRMVLVPPTSRQVMKYPNGWKCNQFLHLHCLWLLFGLFWWVLFSH